MNPIHFRKIMPAGRGNAEIEGWRSLGHLKTPLLVRWQRGKTTDIVIFEDVFASGRCQWLLGDCICLADHGLASIEPITELIEQVVLDLALSIERSGKTASLSDCVPALYTERLRPGGRIDNWYTPSTQLHIGPWTLRIAELENIEFTINNRNYHLDWRNLLGSLRRQLAPSARVLTAITQGDPTEANIAYPLMWLDFEHAGRNAIAGEIANLLWYLLALGGWLVPRYQPDVYARTLRRPLPPVAAPRITSLETRPSRGSLTMTHTWGLGNGRTEAIRALIASLNGPLATVLGFDSANPLDRLRPFLIMRILSVLPVITFQPHDALLCLGKLAQLQDPHLTLDDLLADTCATREAAK